MSFHQVISPILTPDNALIYFLVLVLMIGLYAKGRFARLAKSVALCIIFLFAVMTIIPLGEMAMRPLENASPQGPYPAKVDGIVLLSGDENALVSEDRRLPIAGHAAQREIHLARLAKLYPDARLILSGDTPLRLKGKVKNVDVAQIMQVNLGFMGVGSNRLTIENNSHNTYENARLSKELARPKDGETWLLVTSALHMPRALLCFEKQGWKMTPAPSDYFTTSNFAGAPPYSFSSQLRLLTIALHEYLGLVAYKIFGWVDRLWL